VHHFDKITFSMMNDEALVHKFNEVTLKRNTKNVVLYGVMTEACILQTSIQLLNLGYNVHLVKEAISSMTECDMETAF